MPVPDASALTGIIDAMKGHFGDALLAMDIWDRATVTSIAAHNTQPAAIALFTEVTAAILGAFDGKPFPTLDRYYVLDLQDGHTVAILMPTPEVTAGMLLSTPGIDTGALVGTAIPQVLDGIAAASA